MPLAGRPLEDRTDIAALLKFGLDVKPDEVALTGPSSRLTWHELEAASSRLGANLRGLGLTAGDRVASLMPNCAELLVLYLACFKSGLVTTPLNYRYEVPSIDHALEVSGAALLIAHDERSDELKASSLVPRLQRGIVTLGPGGESDTSLQALIAAEPATLDSGGHDSSAPAAIFFTSGSTGPAKGVTHTRDALAWIFACVAAALEMSPADSYLTGSSMSHIASFMHSFASLTSGGNVIVSRSPSAHDLLPLLREERPTVLNMIPAALAALVRDHNLTGEDFSSLRILSCGGDKLSLELETEFIDLGGCQIDEGYGMTEVGLASLNSPSGVSKEGSIGRPADGVIIAVRDELGSEVGPGRVGRVWVRSRTQMLGYWGDEDASREVVRDGWLDTGDLMRYDDDGYLWFFGRKKQIIVHDGSNISPQEVESTLAEHPAVDVSGVVGIHDLVHGENVRAYVKVKEGSARLTTEELIEFARARIGYRAPDEIVFMDDIPLNPSGKVDRVSLKKMAEDHVNPHVA